VSLKAGTHAEITHGGEDATRVNDSNEFFPTLEERERRVGLRRRDDVLLALNDLNLRHAGVIPTRLREKLADEGMQIHGHSITELIAVVLGSEERFPLKERRTSPRRRRRFLPSDEELVSAISRRYQG
jgi:hypothetical protein